MNTAYLLIGLALGSVLGFLIGWFFSRSRSTGSDGRLEAELRQQVTQRDAELRQTRQQLSEATQAKAAAEARQAAAEKLLEEQRELHERALREARETQAKALADLRDAFKALSADTLKQAAPEFLRLAEQTFGKLQEAAKGELEKRQESIKTLVEPLRQQLETYQQRLQQSETAQADALGKVKEQLAALTQQSLALAAETQQFRMVLKSNQARGRWGEETLRRVVEAAGMSAHCDFSEQIVEGDSKPDLIVHLPGERMIIVDAKVPDLDFLNALESADPATRAESLAQHAAKLKATIRALAERDYPRQFPKALDYVVLFVPAESLFSAALEGDRDLIVWAAERRILLATPASLIALLRSVAVSWQQHAQTENATAIAEAAQELFTRVCRFTEHLERLRSGLERANAAFNDAIGSYQRQVRPAGERLQKLRGETTGRDLADLEPIEGTLRLPS
ncbi:MAG TPA: DNA recombination protein RmuC [Verrucomicrobia bacterium]|nr:DNA recombination protein RmuC [Verrucomicrobiota bacterium]HOP97447.1 DNA recombination protein RmuC [Verrucomicrobiota bacterium]